MNSLSPYVYKKRHLIIAARLFDFIGTLFHRPRSYDELEPKKILVVRLDQLGDIIQTIPLFRSVRNQYPHAKISFLTTSIGAQIDALAELADEVIVWDCAWFDRKRRPNKSLFSIWRTIKTANFDLALEPRGDLRLITLLRLASVKDLVGHGCTGGGFLLDVAPPWEDSWHAIDRNLALIQALGGRAEKKIPDIGRPKTGRFKREKIKMAVHPDAGAASKCWPIQNFAHVIDFLANRGIEVILVGLNEKLGVELSSLLKKPAVNLMGKTSLKELSDSLQECDGLFSNDSGPAHLMSALGGSVWVVWSGTADPSVWMPRGGDVTIFSHQVPCAPCSLSECPVGGHPCLTEIKPDEVAESIWRKISTQREAET